MRYDNGGEFWVSIDAMAVGGVIGAVVSAGISIAAQQSFDGEINATSVIR